MGLASFVSVRRASFVSVSLATCVIVVALAAACRAPAKVDSPEPVDPKMAARLAEAHSLLGEPLFRPRLDSTVRARLRPLASSPQKRTS